MNKNEEYDIVLPPDATFRRVYDFLPYTHWRLKQLLNDYYNAHLERIRAYKEGRYPGYRQRYNIYDNDTGKLIRSNVHLDDLRRFFASKDFPLQKEDTINKRNPKAEQFLEIVRNITEHSKER